jgi:hypothetical protein
VPRFVDARLQKLKLRDKRFTNGLMITLFVGMSFSVIAVAFRRRQLDLEKDSILKHPSQIHFLE